MKRIFIAVIFIQVLVALYLFRSIWIKSNEPKISIHWMKGTDFQPNKKSKYHNYYEPIPNRIIKDIYASPSATYTINQDTLNDLYEHDEQKKENIFRIVTLGDSFTYALRINTKDGWPKILETKLNKELACTNKQFEVINLGVEGYDISYSAERYRLRGRKYRPDLVLWLLNVHNFLQYNDVQIDEEKNLFSLKKDPKHPYIRFEMAFQNTLQKLGRDKLIVLQNGILNEYVRGNLVRTVFMSFSYMPSPYQTLISQISDKHNFVYYFNNITDLRLADQVIPDDGHPNVAGHQTIAKDIMFFLINKDIISCK